MPKYFIAAIATFCMALGAGNARAEEPLSVTLADLFANVEKYSAKEISVMGYFAVHVNLALYESRAHHESRAFQNSLVVGDYDQMELRRSECINKMVEVTGMFLQFTSDVVLHDVTRITLISTGELCWEYEVE